MIDDSLLYLCIIYFLVRDGERERPKKEISDEGVEAINVRLRRRPRSSSAPLRY